MDSTFHCYKIMANIYFGMSTGSESRSACAKDMICREPEGHLSTLCLCHFYPRDWEAAGQSRECNLQLHNISTIIYYITTTRLIYNLRRHKWSWKFSGNWVASSENRRLNIWHYRAEICLQFDNPAHGGDTRDGCSNTFLSFFFLFPVRSWKSSSILLECFQRL